MALAVLGVTRGVTSVLTEVTVGVNPVLGNSDHIKFSKFIPEDGVDIGIPASTVVAMGNDVGLLGFSSTGSVFIVTTLPWCSLWWLPWGLQFGMCASRINSSSSF